MSAYLQTQDLSVGYDGKALIQNVCLEVQKGKIVTLIGPNGSGKLLPGPSLLWALLCRT